MCTNAQCTIIPYMYCTCIFPPSSSAHSLSLLLSLFLFTFFSSHWFHTLGRLFFCLFFVAFRSSRCAVSRMSAAAAAVTARCAVSKCVGQNHRKSLRLVSHFRLVCTVCLNGSVHSLARSRTQCFYVPFELLRLGQALFIFHYISAYLVHTAHIMCMALHCIV